MTILAVCPYCKVGKVRAPRTAVGASATCPRCYNSFTVVDSEPPRNGPARPKTSSPTAITAGTAVAAPEVAEPDSDPEEHEEPEVRLPPIVAPLPPPPRRRERDAESSFALAMVALVLAAVAFGVTYVPYGRLISLLPSLAGMALALFGLIVADKRRLWPAVAVGTNLLILVLVAAVPSWLGLGSWVPQRNDLGDGPRLVPFDGKPAYQIDDTWVDAGRGGWQRDDVRVTIASSWVGKVALIGPKKVQKTSADPYLIVNLNVRNFGGGKVIEYRSWNSAPPEGAPPVRLVDSTGRELKFARFEEGWQLRDRPAISPQLFPTQGSDDLLVFEPPAPGATYVRLELPAWAFGEPGEPVRFQIALKAPAMPAPPGGNGP